MPKFQPVALPDVVSQPLSLGCSWDLGKKEQIDLDISAICFTETGNLNDAAFYNQLVTKDGCVRHSGDIAGHKAGGSEDCETITVDLNKITQGRKTTCIAFVLSAFSNGTLSNCNFVSCVLREGADKTLGKVELDRGEIGNVTSCVLCLLYSDYQTGKWHFLKSVKPTQGRDFSQCLPTVRQQVGEVLNPAAKGDYVLSQDKVFNMKKGQRAVLPPVLTNLVVGLGWTTPDDNMDLDASCVQLVNEGGKFVRAADNPHIYFSHKEEPGIVLTGDNMSGEGQGDDETVIVHLKEVKQNIDALAFTVCVYSDGRTFSEVTDSYVRLFDEENKKEYARFALGSHLKQRALVFCALVRNRDTNAWELFSVGEECDGRRVHEIDDDAFLNITSCRTDLGAPALDVSEVQLDSSTGDAAPGGDAPSAAPGATPLTVDTSEPPVGCGCIVS